MLEWNVVETNDLMLINLIPYVIIQVKEHKDMNVS
jgi:hypothetical protein